MPKFETLPASEVAVGHCVIINHVEQPCGRLLAVVVAIEGELARVKYLNVESDLTSYNVHGCLSSLEEVTPANWFGVEVRIELADDGDVVYWCEPVGESRAKYHDGQTRLWQERGWRGRYVARPNVLKLINEQETALHQSDVAK